MRKVFLMLSVSLFSLNAEAQECVDAPSCTDLGYTQTEADCPNGAVKCPWNSGLVFCGCGEGYQYSCTGTNESPSSAKCGDYYASCNCDSGYKWVDGKCVSSRPKCNIGDIYYTDNTCVPFSVHDSSKTVLGIVVYVNPDGVGGQIMAPWPIDENGNKTSSNNTTMKWGKEGDGINAPNYTLSTEALEDYDSCGNTDKIMAAGDASTYPAAWATRRYAPTSETAGKWCLPAGAVLAVIFHGNRIFNIGRAMSTIGGVNPTLSGENIWSSSESGPYSYNPWVLSVSTNNVTLGNTYRKTERLTVRPVMEF